MIASTAIFTLPSVPFLNPTGHDSPEASSRCTWLSVVRAPMAPQDTRSAMYCGVIMSRNSQPAGRPNVLMSSSSSRATRTPLLMSKLPSSSGSLISPFQPTVVRGFSKYTRMTISRSALRRSRTGFRRLAYSMAARVSWIEQGPITTIMRSSMPCRMRCMACRAANTVSDASLVQANSRMTCAGGFSSLISRMRRSSVLCDTVLLLGCPPGMVPSGCHGTFPRGFPDLAAQKPPVRWRLFGDSFQTSD